MFASPGWYGSGMMVKLAWPRRSDHSSWSCSSVGNGTGRSGLVGVGRKDETEGLALREGAGLWERGGIDATSVAADDGATVGD
jgi:hypothetical protein